MRGIPASEVDVALLRGSVPVLLDQIIDAVEGRGARAATFRLCLPRLARPGEP